MVKEIEAKTEIGYLKIEKSGREGIKLTIELPKKGDVSIVVDKFELAEALELNSKGIFPPKPKVMGIQNAKII